MSDAVRQDHQPVKVGLFRRRYGDLLLWSDTGVETVNVLAFIKHALKNAPGRTHPALRVRLEDHLGGAGGDPYDVSDS
jgi:hypothetical protein